jgi:hypothetical protein
LGPSADIARRRRASRARDDVSAQRLCILERIAQATMLALLNDALAIRPKLDLDALLAAVSMDT